MKDRNVMRERCGEIGMACRALFWLSIICLVLLLGCEVWLALFCPGTNFSLTLTQTPSGMTGTGTLTGSLEAVLFGYEPLKVYFENGILSEAAQAVPKTVFLIGFAERIVLVIVAIGIFWCLRVIFRNIDRSESPFCGKNVRMIFWIGILVIVYAHVKCLLFPVLYLLAGVGGGNLTVVNPAAVGLGLLIISLSYIFEYGVTLQRESDETL